MQEEQFCKIILNLGQWFRRRCHLIWSSCGPSVLWRGTRFALLVEGTMGNLHVKSF